MVTPILRVVVVVSLFSAGGIVSAQENSPWEPYSINAGGIYSTSDTELRFDSERLGVGVTLDTRETLGMDREALNYRIDAFWRFGSTRRHQLEVHYFAVDNEGIRTLDAGTRIGDRLFPEGVAVNSQFDLDFLNIDYSYAFFQDDRIRLAGAIGIHTTAFELNVDAPRRGLSVSETFTSPVPVLGLRGDFNITERWRFRATTDLVYLPLNEYDVSVADSLLALEFMPFEHVGIGLGLNSIRFRIESEADVDGKARQQLIGGLAYLKLRF